MNKYFLFIAGLISIALLPNTTVWASDSWYAIQAGSTGYGYYREVYEAKDHGYSYRYNLTRLEGNSVYQENIGALCDEDLKPRRLNLNKTYNQGIETTNVAYKEDKNSGIYTVDISGARSEKYERRGNKSGIFDVFFPVWVKKNFASLKPHTRKTLKVFGENPEKHTFLEQDLVLEVKDQNPKLNCLNLAISMGSIQSLWCINRDGILMQLKMGDIVVSKVANEAEAKKVIEAKISALSPKDQK